MSKKQVALVVLSDTGLRPNRNSIIWNDLRYTKKIIEYNGTLAVTIYNRENVFEAINADVLIIGYGGTVNYGGQQTKAVQDVINLANRFKGPVVFFSNDVEGRFDNKPREGFVKFERPVYFANPSQGKTVNVETKNLDVIDSFDLNEAFEIGKELSQKPEINYVPKFDVVYGGGMRNPLKKRLEQLADNCNMVTFGLITQDNPKRSLPESTMLKTSKIVFNNDEMRILNCLGKYSVLLHEKYKDYFTNRVFEQMASNSIVLFDKDWPIYQMFWRSDNVFENMDQLLKMIKKPYLLDRVKLQHKMLKSFNFDEYISKECSNIEKLAKV